jgi:hypothetical protein
MAASIVIEDRLPMRKYQMKGIAAMLEYVKLWKIYPISQMMQNFRGVLVEHSNEFKNCMIQSGNLFYNHILDECKDIPLLHDMLKHNVGERWRSVWIHSGTGEQTLLFLWMLNDFFHTMFSDSYHMLLICFYR